MEAETGYLSLSDGEREFLDYMAALERDRFERAEFTPLGDSPYGVGVHWTTRTYPREGKPLPFNDAVEQFDVDSFVDQVAETGAGHVLFTAAHVHGHFIAGHPVIDDILPGRTADRDLLGEIARALADRDIKLIMYYNSCHARHAPQWKDAMGANEADHSEFFDNYERILQWIGEQYGDLITAYWIDGGYSLNAMGDVPWRRLYDATKAGNSDRLVCWNPGVQRHYPYTIYQDYWAGECIDMNFQPRGPTTPFGLPWHAFCEWHHSQRPRMKGGMWGLYSPMHREYNWQLPDIDLAVQFANAFQNVGGTVTFNLFCYQEGDIIDVDMEAMRRIKNTLK